MTVAHITVMLILGIIDGARRVIGDDAIKVANTVEGLKVTSSGEIVITVNSLQILGKLLKAYEAELHGEVVLDLDVRLNVKTANTAESR